MSVLVPLGVTIGAYLPAYGRGASTGHSEIEIECMFLVSSFSPHKTLVSGILLDVIVFTFFFS